MTLVKNLDFQTGDRNQWTGLQIAGPSSNFAVLDANSSTSRVHPLEERYRYAAKITTRAGDPALLSDGTRTELLWGQGSAPSLMPNNDYYFGFSIYLPDGSNTGLEAGLNLPRFPSPGASGADGAGGSNTGHKALCQWKQANPDSGAPPFDMMYMYNRFQEGYSGSPWTIPSGRGQHDFVWHILFSSSASVGFIEIWHQGPTETALTKKVNKYFHQTLLNNNGGYFKHGIYQKIDETKTSIMYSAGMKVGTTYADVVPVARAGSVTTPAPVASFTFSPATPTTNQPVTLNASASTGTGLTYSWDVTP